MAVTDYISLLVKLAVILIIFYFIYDYIKTPLYLTELTRDYNELVDQFHLALKETAIAYIHIGSKRDCMPVTIQMRTIDGLFVETKQSAKNHPTLYVPGTGPGIVRPFSVFGYIRNDRVYIHRMNVRIAYNVETFQSTEQTYIFDKSLQIDDDDGSNESLQVSHPATWVHENGIDEDQFYQLVVNPAGLFTLVRIESFRHIEGIPVTPPTYREYKKTLTGITKK